MPHEAGSSPSAPRFRVVFMGTPDFAVPTLEALVSRHDVTGVFTQPDRPAGRGMRVAESPVRSMARNAGLPVYQPVTLRDNSEALDVLEEWRPDVIVVAAYGLILPRAVLYLPPRGSLNVHASLLPRWRGAAPVSHAILAGDKETGVTIMRMDEGLDTGPVLAQRRVVIGADETAGALTERLARAGAELLLDALPAWLASTLAPRPQDDSLATKAPRLRRQDGRLAFSGSAADLARRVRAMSPWPGAFLELDGQTVTVHTAAAVDAPCEGAAPAGSSGIADMPVPGTVVVIDGMPAVATADGCLRLDVVQPAGKRPMPGDAFARGRRGFVGSVLDG